MKKYWLTTKGDTNLATYYITVDGDIVDTRKEADITGCAAQLFVHGFFAGSVEEMKSHAAQQYTEAVLREYTEKVEKENHIQEWFAGEPATLNNAIDCIIETYPLPVGVIRADVLAWVTSEVKMYNDEVEDGFERYNDEQKLADLLPTE